MNRGKAAPNQPRLGAAAPLSRLLTRQLDHYTGLTSDSHPGIDTNPPALDLNPINRTNHRVTLYLGA